MHKFVRQHAPSVTRPGSTPRFDVAQRAGVMQMVNFSYNRQKYSVAFLRSMNSSAGRGPSGARISGDMGDKRHDRASVCAPLMHANIGGIKTSGPYRLCMAQDDV